MKILRRMVFIEFFGVFIASLAALVMMFMLVDFFDRVQKLVGEGGAPLKLLALYLLYKVPQILYDVTPLTLPLAALITLGVLNGRRELMAMRAAAIPVRAALRPVFLFALLAAAALFSLGETVLPEMNVQQNLAELKLKRFLKSRDAAIKGKKRFEVRTYSVKGWYRGAKGLYLLGDYNIKNKTIRDLIILEVNRDFRVTRKIDVESAQWDQGHWIGTNVVVSDFPQIGEILVSKENTMTLNIPESPSDLELMEKDTSQMGFLDLADFISRLEAGGSDMRPFRVDLWAKLSYPLSGFILLVLAVPLGLRGGKGTGVATGIVLSLIICLSYYEFYAWLLSMGRGGVIGTPVIAAWAGPTLFGLAAIPMYLRSN